MTGAGTTNEYGLVQRAPSSDVVGPSRLQADIVLIHGINGTPARTWVHEDKSGRVDWTSDNGFLPSRFPYARIFTLKWNASVLRYNSDAEIKHVASSLLSELKKHRQSHEEKHRKLIFICHSLGGLLVQRALTLAAVDEDRQLLQESTVGIIFLGTPHGGSSLASIARSFLWVTDSPISLLKLLSPGSPKLSKLTGHFRNYYFKRQSSDTPLSIVSFCEMQRTPVLGFLRTKVVPLDRSFLGVVGEIVEHVHKHHRNIAQFKNPDDPVLEIIVGHLKRFIDGPGLKVPVRAIGKKSQIHQVPEKSERFFGQQEYRERMYNILIGTGAQDDKHLVVWGQRKIGKSELVLRFAIDHRHEYDTVKWFDATDEQTLRWQVENFYDFLSEEQNPELKDLQCNNQDKKCEAVRRWLETQKRCLIVYDNVDLASGYIKKYFPHNCPAHRIVIGTNPSMCDFGNTDIEVGPMTVDDASGMLLGIAGMSDDTDQDTRGAAQDFVKQLGCVPFYITLAAQDLRDSRESLLEFLDNLKKQEQRCGPKYHNSQATYEIGEFLWSRVYERIKQRPDSLILLNLFALLDGFDIRSQLLDRFCHDRQRWNDEGAEVRVTPLDAGIEPEISSLLFNPDRFRGALQPLIDTGFVRRRPMGPHSQIQMQPLVQQYVVRMMRSDERLEWIRRVIRLVSHAVPEDNCLELRNCQGLWPCLIPHVLKCHKIATTYAADGFRDLDDVHEALVFMLLSSLGHPISSSHDDRGLLSLIDSLLRYRSTPYQRCKAAKWRAYFLWYRDRRKDEAERLLADIQEREQSLIAQNSDLDTSKNNAGIADVILHRAQCLFDQGSYSIAQDVLESWSSRAASRLDKRCQRLIDTATYKTLAFSGAAGNFDEAKTGFQAILRQARPEGHIKDMDEFNWVAVLLGQLYCKTGEHIKAMDLVTPWIRRYHVHDYIASDLKLIYCEALLKRGQFPELEAQLDRLDRDLQDPGQKGRNPRAPSQLLAAKKLRARSFYLRELWPQTINAWRGVLSDLRIEESDLESQPDILLDPAMASHLYDAAEAILSLAVTYYQMGDKRRARRYRALISKNPTSIEYPSAEIDYSEWAVSLESQFRSMDSRQPLESRYFRFWAR